MRISPERLGAEAEATGFQPDVLEWEVAEHFGVPEEMVQLQVPLTLP